MEPAHIRATYNDIHDLIKASAEKIAEFKPNIIIAIGVYNSAPLEPVVLLKSIRRRVSDTIPKIYDRSFMNE
jgi:hypothetical protein